MTDLVSLSLNNALPDVNCCCHVKCVCEAPCHFNLTRRSKLQYWKPTPLWRPQVPLCLALSIVVILFQGAPGFLSWKINNKISFVSESSHCCYVWLFDLEGMPWWDCFGQGKFQSVFWWMIHHCESMRMSKGVVAKKAKSAVIHCFHLFIKLVFIVFD